MSGRSAGGTPLAKRGSGAAAAVAALASASASGSSPAGRAANSPASSAADRFTLLLLEDGEHFFSSHTAYHWEPDGRR